MKTKWENIITREGVDLVTISGIDVVFFDWHWQIFKKKAWFFTWFENKSFVHYGQTSIHTVGCHVQKKFFNSPEIIEKYYREGKVFLREIENTTNAWQKRIEKNKETKLLLSAYNDFQKQFKKVNHIYCVTSWLAIEAWQADFEPMLTGMIKRNNLEKHKEKIIASVHKPWKNTVLLDIQSKIKKGESIKKIVKDYQFLRSWSVIWNKPLGVEWARSIGKASKHSSFKKIYSLSELIHILKPNQIQKHHLELAPYITFFKDWRDDLRRKHVYSWSFLFQAIAKKFNIAYNDLGYFTLQEIENALKADSFDEKLIKLRKNNPCVVVSNLPKPGVRVIVKDIPKRYREVRKKVDFRVEKDLIKGIVAQTGKVKGKVRIIRSYHDIKKVQNHDILVASTTHPTYLPAMQKALAFVTDEGGIISHAAIVARELKKPCIVGTKLATQVLKDGDMVEVDAEKGVVKIIKRR